MRKKLTARQQEIYDFLVHTIREKGYPPTIREIMDAFQIASTNGVRTTLSALEKKGYIKRQPMLSSPHEEEEECGPEELDVLDGLRQSSWPRDCDCTIRRDAGEAVTNMQCEE